MKASFVKKEILIWFIVLVPLAFSIYYWPQFPDRVPIHWDIQGNVNGYGSRFMGAFFLPLLNIGLYFLLLLVPRIDPKKENYAQFETTYFVLRIVIHAFLAGIFILTTLKSVLNYPINLDISYIVQLSVVFMFLILGNFMGKIRPNYMVGIRTPWTLANEDVWVKTHRATGRVWVAGSITYLMVVLFLHPVIQWPEMVYIGLLIGFPLVYSYIVFKRITDQGQ